MYAQCIYYACYKLIGLCGVVKELFGLDVHSQLSVVPRKYVPWGNYPWVDFFHLVTHERMYYKHYCNE